MKKAVLARKVGMTQIYGESGRVIPVTVVKVGPCKVVAKKDKEKDGYEAVQIGFEEKKPSRVNKPQKGYFERAGVSPCKVLKEFRLENTDEYNLGDELKSDVFSPGEYVDITGISKGKGFSGSIKRHNFSRGPMTHGSHYHRGSGSLGSMEQGHVFKGRKLPGRMGGKKSTILNLEVIDVDTTKNILLIKGAVPGPRGGLLEVKEAVKRKTG